MVFFIEANYSIILATVTNTPQWNLLFFRIHHIASSSDLSLESFQSVLWRVSSSTRTLTCFTAEQQREIKRGEGLEVGGEERGSERTEHKIPSVLGWMAHFLAWREQLWIQFVPLANCVPEVPCGGRKNANGWQALQWVRSGLDPSCVGTGVVWL